MPRHQSDITEFRGLIGPLELINSGKGWKPHSSFEILCLFLHPSAIGWLVKSLKKTATAGHRWLMSVTLATQEEYQGGDQGELQF
jgi:hypothetical protein